MEAQVSDNAIVRNIRSPSARLALPAAGGGDSYLEDYTHTDLFHRGGSKRIQFPRAGCFIQHGCYVGIMGLFSQEGKPLEYMNNQASNLPSWLVCLGWSST